MGRFGRVGGNEKPAERPICADRPPPFLGGWVGQRIGGGRSGRISHTRARAPARKIGSNKLKGRLLWVVGLEIRLSVLLYRRNAGQRPA